MMKQMMEKVWDLQDEWETAIAQDDLVMAKEIAIELAEINAQLDKFEMELA